MTDSFITQHRLTSQAIHQPTFSNPTDVVAWFGAMQGQDFLAAKWAVGLRLPNATDSTIEAAIANRSIIRTWALRGTLYLLAASDVRWILDLLRPRLHRLSDSYLRKLDISTADLTKSYDVISQTLQGHQELTRSEVKDALQQASIKGIPINLLLCRAAFDGLICCGVRRGSENTYTLLDEWVPATRTLEGDEALAELTRRYFTSHGPASIQDFVWWSGLTVGEAKSGIDAVQSQLTQESINGQTYWMANQNPVTTDLSRTVHLLPSFDEYLVGYKDRGAALGSLDFGQVSSAGNGIFFPIVLINGRVVGTWKRMLKKDTVSLQTNLFEPLQDEHMLALTDASKKYSQFIDKSLIVFP